MKMSLTGLDYLLSRERSFLNLRFIFLGVRNNSVSLNIYYFKFGGAKNSSEKVELD